MTDSGSAARSDSGSAARSGSGDPPGPGRIGIFADVRPHAYDPDTHPELFEGVLARRVVAFVIDVRG